MRCALALFAALLLCGTWRAVAAGGAPAIPAQPHVVVNGYPSPAGDRFALVYADGSVRASTFGDAFSLNLRTRITGGARVPTGGGYWEVASDGNVFGYGTAPALGGLGGFPLNAPVFAIAPTPSGKGYLLVGRDGGVFTFGDAHFYGSASNLRLNQPVVGITTNAGGAGYRLVSRDGGVFGFGKVVFAGSLPRRHVRANDVVGIAATPTDQGYWIARRNGRVYAFGDASPLGGATVSACDPIAAIIPNPVAQGYRLVTDSGRTIPRGVAPGGDQSTGTNRVCGRLTGRMELPATTVTAGATMTGFLVLDNETGHPIRIAAARICAPKWIVSIGNQQIPNWPLFTQECSLRPFFLPVGEQQFPFAVTAEYLNGLNPCHCLGPLPPDTYAVRLNVAGAPFPPVASIAVQVVAPT
jgi:hypothetical protein